MSFFRRLFRRDETPDAPPEIPQKIRVALPKGKRPGKFEVVKGFKALGHDRSGRARRLREILDYRRGQYGGLARRRLRRHWMTNKHTMEWTNLIGFKGSQKTGRRKKDKTRGKKYR